MSETMVQIRSVPKDLHRRLKARAAIEGVSMSSYVLREIQKSLDRPTRQEILERLQTRPVRSVRRSAAAVMRAEQNGRGSSW